MKWSCNRIICCEIYENLGFQNWRFFGFYGTSYGKEKTEFWDNLEEGIQNCGRLWLILREESDHSLILLSTYEKDKMSIRPFRYLKAWSKDTTSHSVVEKAWQRRCLSSRES